MRILMISDAYKAHYDGEPASLELFRLRLIEAGHTVTLLVPEGATPDRMPGVLRIPPRFMLMDPADPAVEAAPVRALADRLRDDDYDIVHVHAPFLGNAFGKRLAQALELPAIETWLRPFAAAEPFPSGCRRRAATNLTHCAPTLGA